MGRRGQARICVSILTLIVVLLFVVMWVGPAGAAGSGLQNQGFEYGLASWTVTVPSTAPAGTVAAVGTETATQYPIYSTMGITSISPLSGFKMLRLGLPKDVNSAQVKGVEAVQQTFYSDGRQIDLAYFLLTVDHRSGDMFIIDVKNSFGTSVGNISVGISTTLNAIPYSAPISISKTAKYWYSGWQDVHIKNLPSGTLTISYTVSNTTNSAHDTWAYVDHRNLAPVAGAVAISPKPVYAGNQTFTATPSAFADPDNDPLTYTYTWTMNGKTMTGAAIGNGGATLITPVVRGDVIAVTCIASDGLATSAAATDSVTVSNSAPVAGTVAITPKPAYTNNQLTATPSGFTDADGDPLSYHYAWTKNGTAVGSDSATLDLSVAGNGDRGDTIAVSVTASDGVAASAPATDSLTISDSPPVADFTWAPGGPGNNTDQIPHEGDVIGLYSDPSTDPDGTADIVKWEWRIDKPGQTEEVYNPLNDYQSPIGFIVPYDDGTYTVKLTVWDAAGQSSSVTKAIEVQNQAPRVNALNVEVLTGGTAQLVGRFLDTGWMDNHTASWISPSGSSTAGNVTEDHLATIDSGYVGGTVTGGSVPGQETWQLTTSDEASSSSDTFKVSTIAPDPNRFEDQDNFPNVHSLNSDGAYLSYIQSEGDVDIYEVKTPDGQLLPQGTEILATLRDLPADYDLVVFEGVTGSTGAPNPQAAPFMHSPFLAAPFMHSPFMHSDTTPAPFMHSPFMHSPYEDAAFMQAPFMHSPFMHSPFLNSPYVNAPFVDAPFLHSPFQSAPFMHSPFLHSPFMHSPIPAGWTNLDGYPLSEMSYTGTANDNISGIDISFSELGFDNEAMQNLQVLGYSANLGTQPETVLATAGYPQTSSVQGHVYVAVKGTPGNYSATLPYTLQIETSRPYDALAQGNVDQPPVVTNPTTSTSVVYTPTSAPLTLFVTQLDRLRVLYPAGSTAGDTRDGGQIVRDSLLSVAGRSDVLGKIISLPGNLYTAWDEEPWRVDLADTLTQAIRSEIQAQLSANPSIRYVVVVGDDKVVPFRRVPDQTVIGNEQDYRDQAFILPPSATLSSIANGNFLTDDYYVDQNPISWSGSYLYIPDLSVSRLVEKPAEIANAIQTFEAANGVLTPQAAVVSGYSFMADGAAAVRTTLTSAGVTVLGDTSLVGDTWTGTDLWNALKQAPNITSLNAHFTHFAGLSANGYAQSVAGSSFNASELFLSTDVATATASDGSQLFKSKLVFSMGCHSGLNVPDEQAVTTSAGDPIQPGLDLPQAMMEQGAVYMAPTGYGYGDTVGIAGTEALVGFIAQKLVGTSSSPPSASVGLALVEAKQAYLGSLSTLTPYEQKSSVEYEMYGMPQYHLPTSIAPAAAAGVLTPSSAVSTSSTALDPFRLVLTERSMQTSWTNAALDQTYPLALQSSPSGSYVTAGGNSEANAERPIHPTVVVPLADQPSQGPVHGFVYKAGTYAYLSPADSFQPAISRITNEWEVQPTEFQVATSGFWPAEPAVLNTIQKPNGYRQTFIAVPAQFKATSTTPTVIGNERVWSYLEAEALRSTTPAGGSEDWMPPSVLGYDFWPSGGQVTLSVDAQDASGISRIVVLIMGPNGMATPAGGDHDFGNPGVPNGNDGTYQVTFDPGGADPASLTLMIQVVDGRGNVTTLTGKGVNIRLTSGLRNPSFEQGAKYWTLSQPAPNNAVVVGAEGPDQYPIFSTLGVTVEPFSGTQMLRLGAPKDQDAHQIKGISSATQQFISDGGDILVAYRAITFEPRLDDFFDIYLTDTNGNSVGQIAGKALPFSLGVQLPNNQTFLDTGWVVLRITNVPAGKVLTLSYALNNTKSASKDTWVYVDQGN